MIIRLYSERQENKIIYGILLENGTNRMTFHAPHLSENGNLLETLDAYERFCGKKIDTEELLNLHIC